MIETLLKFAGLWTPDVDRIVRIEPTIHPAAHPALLLLAGVLLAAGVWWLYRREDAEVTLARRIAMASARALLLAMLLVILLRPVLAVTTRSQVNESLALLVDTSSSMQIADVRDRSDDQQRAAIALGQADASAGLRQDAPAADNAAHPARMDLVKAALKNQSLDMLNRIGREFQLSVFNFDRQATELGVGSRQTPERNQWVDRLQAKGDSTALGDAIRQVLVAKRGQALGGILVISDGANNSGISLLSAAQLAREERVPIYCYGVGITSPKDIQVSAILAPDVAFVQNELPVTVRLRTQGYRGQRGTLVLKMDGEQVDSQEVAFDEEGERTIGMRFTPGKTGDFVLEASIQPQSDEVVTDNNTSPPKHLRIVNTRIKVLQIEQTPRWEFKYLQAMLMRDPRVEYHCWLIEADAGTEAENSKRPSPYINSFPTRKEDLLRYDVVILGDVEPRKLPAEALEWLNTFVANYGGGLIVEAGSRAMPMAYRRTPLEKMLPVELDAVPMVKISTDSERPIHLELTPAGKASSMLRLAEKDTESQGRWEKLPPLYWTARVSGAKPAAEVLAVDPDGSKATRAGKMPVMAIQQYGLGSVLYMGTDNTWRWRLNEGEALFNRFWGQTVERLAMGRLLGGGGWTQLSLDRNALAPGDRVTVYGRVYREGDFEPVIEPRVDAYFIPRGQPGNRREVIMRALPDQPGMYRGELIAPGPGQYQVCLSAAAQTHADFVVIDTHAEHGEAALNEAGLRELTVRTGGAFVREEGLYQLPDQMRHVVKPVLSTYEVEIWSSPLFFLAGLALGGTEWWLRKRALLK